MVQPFASDVGQNVPVGLPLVRNNIVELRMKPFETVYTVDHYYDGPRSGVADFRGKPHFYRSVYLDTNKWNPDEDRFELTPIPSEICALAIEDFLLWQRWQVAELAGTAPALSNSAERVLPADAARHAELRAILAPYLRTDLAHRVIARGDFRPGDKTGEHGGELSPLGSLIVRWTSLEGC
jgi:hypothetical protein